MLMRMSPPFSLRPSMGEADGASTTTTIWGPGSPRGISTTIRRPGSPGGISTTIRGPGPPGGNSAVVAIIPSAGRRLYHSPVTNAGREFLPPARRQKESGRTPEDQSPSPPVVHIDSIPKRRPSQCYQPVEAVSAPHGEDDVCVPGWPGPADRRSARHRPRTGLVESIHGNPDTYHAGPQTPTPCNARTYLCAGNPWRNTLEKPLTSVGETHKSNNRETRVRPANARQTTGAVYVTE